jgi:hypothetical protein
VSKGVRHISWSGELVRRQVNGYARSVHTSYG